MNPSDPPPCIVELGKTRPTVFSNFSLLFLEKSHWKNGFQAKLRKWPGGVVPVEISSNFTTEQKDHLQRVFDLFRKKSCINFVNRTSEAVYVSVVPHSSICLAGVGYWRQYVRLADGCFPFQGSDSNVHANLFSLTATLFLGKLIHEFMHTLGSATSNPESTEMIGSPSTRRILNMGGRDSLKSTN